MGSKKGPHARTRKRTKRAKAAVARQKRRRYENTVTGLQSDDRYSSELWTPHPSTDLGSDCIIMGSQKVPPSKSRKRSKTAKSAVLREKRRRQENTLARLQDDNRLLADTSSMVVYCSVPNCGTYATEPGVSFHHYPKAKEVREAWLMRLRMGREVAGHTRVCSKHFVEDDFVYGVGAKMFGWRRRCLSPGAVPSQNLPMLALDSTLCTQHSQNRRNENEATMVTDCTNSTKKEDLDTGLSVSPGGCGIVIGTVVGSCSDINMASSSRYVFIKEEPQEPSSSVLPEDHMNAEESMTSSFCEVTVEVDDSTWIKEEPEDTLMSFSPGSYGTTEELILRESSETTMAEEDSTCIKEEPQDTILLVSPGSIGNTEGFLTTDSPETTMAEEDSISIKEEPQDTILLVPTGSMGNTERLRATDSLETTMAEEDSTCIKEEPQDTILLVSPGSIGNTEGLIATGSLEATMAEEDSTRIKEEPQDTIVLVSHGIIGNTEGLVTTDSPEQMISDGALEEELENSISMQSSGSNISSSLIGNASDCSPDHNAISNPMEGRGTSSKPGAVFPKEDLVQGGRRTLQSFEAQNRENAKKKPTCNVCSATFTRNSHLKTHLNIHIGKLFTCTNCSTTFTHASSLRKHAKVCTGHVSHKCKVCLDVFVSKSGLASHMTKHSREESCKFETGLVAYSSHNSLVDHVQRDNCGQLYVGDQCPVAFSEACTPDIHVEADADEIHTKTESNSSSAQQPLGCSISTEQLPHENLPMPSSNHNAMPMMISELGEEIQVREVPAQELIDGVHSTDSLSEDSNHETEKADDKNQRHTLHLATSSEASILETCLRKGTEMLFTCNTCSASFTRASTLTEHMRCHMDEGSQKCEAYISAFASKSCPHNHVAVHSHKKPFKCEHCAAAYSRHQALNIHRRVHAQEKPYKCELCPASFSVAYYYKVHMEKHTGEKAHRCKFCPAGFTKLGGLKRHMGIHTGERPYKCELCSAAFAESQRLKSHMWSHTGEKPYKCELCPSTFAQRRSLNHHMATHKGSKKSM